MAGAPALLLVDDRPENLLALEAVLEPLGLPMLRARSGEEALRQLLREEIAVIVLDVQMPGIDGFETAAAIKERERTRNIPIIFVTALSREPEHRLRGYATGAVDYVFKPVDPDLLRAKVRVFVELHQASRRLQEQADVLAARTAELERSNADLEQFASIASHDLQEPLRVITGYLELLADELGDDLAERPHSWIGRTLETAGRMESLIADLLVYARSSAGVYRPEPVDLDESLATALVDLAAAERDDVEIHAEPLGWGMGSPSELRRIFQNLVGNALKHRGDEPPKVRILADRQPGWVQVCVTDNGPGVPETDLRRVFGMFERVDDQPSPGTGLGLAVCRRLVERTGGTIWMERNPGAGVTVAFTLPAVPA